MSKKKKNKPQGTKELRLADEIASREVATFVSSLDYLPNPDPILKAKGGNIQVYRNFVDGHLNAVKSKRISAITGRPWTIDGSDGDTKKSKFIEEYLWKLEMRNIIEQMMEAIGMGFAVHEIIWDSVDTELGKLILPVAIKDKPQEWFRFDDEGALILQKKDCTREMMPERKFLVTRRQATASNPYGVPVYASCFWPMAFKKGGLKFWMIFIEKYGMPKAIGKATGTATEQEQQKFLKALAGLVRDAVAVIPQNGTVELLEANSAASNPHKEIIQWADSEISKAWLGETLTTEQTSSGGTQAMATVHNDVRSDLAIDDAAMVESSVNQLIKWIYEINWPTEKIVPWMNVVFPEDLQVSRLDRDVKLQQGLGVRFSKEYIAKTYGIDQKFFEVVDTTQMPGAMFAEHDPKPGKAKVRNTSHELRKQVNEFTEQLAENCEKVDFLAPIRELVANAKSLEEVRDKLIGCYAEMPMDDVAKEMEQAFIAADLAGRFSILKKAGIIDG